MVQILKAEARIRRASNQRPNSLVLSIPPTIRDSLELTPNMEITLEAHIKNDERYVIVRLKK